MIKKIYNYFAIVIVFPFFIFEVLKYKFFKIKNSELSYQYMIKLFTIFDGHIINIISEFLSQKKLLLQIIITILLYLLIVIIIKLTMIY